MEPRNRRETGQMLVLFALALGVIMGFVAMAIDVGIVLHERRSLQNAADAAALAGVRELPESPSTAVAVAQQWAEKNGYSGANGATVTVNTPYYGDVNSIEVVIEEDVPFLFASVLGLENTGVNARAVANNPTVGVGLLALNSWGGPSFSKSGNGSLIVNGGGAVMVNDASEGGTQHAGSGNIISSGGFYYYYEGSWDSSGGSGQISPEPVPVSYQMPDPLADLVPPDPYAIGTSPFSGGTAADPATLKLSSGDFTLLPGTYWGGIEVGSTANVTFLPGVYVLAGGGFKLTGSGTVVGDGVFIYNTFDPENTSGAGQCDQIRLQGSAQFNLTAPTEGPYTDILFWQDVACTNPMKHAGTGDFTAGIIYLPGAMLDLSGSGNVGTLQIVAHTIDISGNLDLIIDSQNYFGLQVPDNYKLTE